jgi:hypothetical protein
LQLNNAVPLVNPRCTRPRSDADSLPACYWRVTPRGHWADDAQTYRAATYGYGSIRSDGVAEKLRPPRPPNRLPVVLEHITATAALAAEDGRLEVKMMDDFLVAGGVQL